MEIIVNVTGVEAIDLNTVLGTRPVGRYRSGDYDERPEEGPYTLADMLTDKLVEKIAEDTQYPSLRDMVQRVRESVLREKLEPIIEEAIQGPIRKTNTFGEPTSGTTTLRELIVEEVKKLLNEKRRDRTARTNDNLSLLEEIISGKTRAILHNELKDEFEMAKQKVKDIVREEGSKLMAEALTNAAEAVRPARRTRPIVDNPQA